MPTPVTHRALTIPPALSRFTEKRPAAAPRPEEAVLVFTIGDISQERGDAIVNPSGAGLVDLAVLRSAGPDLLDEFHRRAAELSEGRLMPGRAVVTGGFGLAARYVVHCGPPVYADGHERARADLESCHVEALRLARERELRSISFPAIGTGMHRFPMHEAADVSVRTVVAELAARPAPALVRFVLFGPSIFNAYLEAAVVALRELPIRTDRTATFSVRRSG
jgi:O-acetyl-ADP-ribose deacetylase (regulator of RNase III)